MTLFDHTNFYVLEDSAVRDLFEAFETSHKRHLVDSGDEDLMLSHDGAGLSAVCRSARLGWAHFLCDELAGHFDYDVFDRTVNQPVFLFTLVDIRCARPSGQLNVDLQPIVRRLQRGLRNCNYIGAVEPGLYSHITYVGTNLQRGSCVSWHLHALVWGLTRDEAKHLAAKLNRTGKYVPIAPGQTGADQLQVREGEFPETLAYLLKRPKKAYRLGLRRDSVASGEPSHIQYNDPLRAGERLTLYLHMRHLSLPDMWVAGGEGRKVLATVKRRCRSATRRYERMSREARRYCRGPRRQLFRC